MPYRAKITVAVAAFVAAGSLSIGLSSCSVKVSTNNPPTIPATALQEEFTERIKSESDTPPESITCAHDLVGEVGKTTSCEVVMGENNIVQADLIVTKVEGNRIDFDYSPSLTKEQLEKVLEGSTDAAAVTCDSGLEGKVGASTRCAIEKDESVMETTISVKKVEGLYLGLTNH